MKSAKHLPGKILLTLLLNIAAVLALEGLCGAKRR